MKEIEKHDNMRTVAIVIYPVLVIFLYLSSTSIN